MQHHVLFLGIIACFTLVASNLTLADSASSQRMIDAHMSYFDCIKTLEDNSNSIKNIIILEGLENQLPLHLRREKRSLTADEASTLIRIHSKIVACRQFLMDASAADRKSHSVYRTVFNSYDEIYSNLLDKTLSVSAANEYLIDYQERMLDAIAEINKTRDN